MIGLAVALAARRAQFPEEFELLERLSASVFQMGRLWWLPVKAIRPVKQEDWMVVSDKLAAAFGLKLVGKGNRKIPLGFLRIPSSVGQPEYVDRGRNMVREPILGCARWTFDLSVIRSWGTNAS